MDPLSILTIASPIIDKVVERIPDPVAREKAQAEIERDLLKAMIEQNAAQADLNRLDAQSGSLFQSGWRPSVGWICAAGLAMQAIVAPLILWIGQLLGKTLSAPPIAFDTIMSILVPLLGLGAYRTFEKVKGVAR